MNTNTNKTSNNVMTVAAIVMAAFTTLAASAATAPAAKPVAKHAPVNAPAAVKHRSALDAAVVAPWARVVGSTGGNDVAVTATA